MSIYQQQLFGARTFLGYTLDPDTEGVKNNLLLSDNVLVELWDGFELRLGFHLRPGCELGLTRV